MQEYAYETAGYSRPKQYPNLRKIASQSFMGITALVGGEPWLVIGFDSKDYLLENQSGNLQKLNAFNWKPATEHSRLVAASRSEDSPFKMGTKVDGQTIKNLHYDGDWFVNHGNGHLPLAQYVAALEANKWSHDVGEREDEKSEPLKCPECGSHTLELIDRNEHRFSCKSCSHQFHHEVLINPKAHVVSYEVDKSDDFRPYAPGPDDPKKHPTCDNCSYCWESHHEFAVTGGHCPRCGKKHTYQQEDIMEMEKGKKKASINLDRNGQELVNGKPYLLHSPRYKVPDLVYIVKSEPTQVEAAIESGEEALFPIIINEKQWLRMQYAFEPFIGKVADYDTFLQNQDYSAYKCPRCYGPVDRYADNAVCQNCGENLGDIPSMPGYSEMQNQLIPDSGPGFGNPRLNAITSEFDSYEDFSQPPSEDLMDYRHNMVKPEWGDTIDCPYCGNMISPRDYDEDFEEYTCPGCRMNFSQDDLHTHWDQTASVKKAWDYNNTTNSMGGRDTGAPISDSLPGYGTDITNPSENAAQPTGPNPLMHEDLGQHGVLYSPRGSVHVLQNQATGSYIITMSDGNGGIMGWSAYTGQNQMGGINWSTQDMLKVQNAINAGLYLDPMNMDPGELERIHEIPLPIEEPLTVPETFPSPVEVPEEAPEREREKIPAGMNPVAPVAKVARKSFSPNEQKDLINEGEGETARNISKLRLEDSHYENQEKDSVLDTEVFWW